MIVSWLALVLSAASLSWQAWTWFYSGPVLRVQSTSVFTDAARPGVPDEYIVIEVINRGRAAATIRSWGIEDPSGASLTVKTPLPFSDELPARLESHASASFYIHWGIVFSHSEELGVPYKKLRPWVQAATGRRVYARKGVPAVG